MRQRMERWLLRVGFVLAVVGVFVPRDVLEPILQSAASFPTAVKSFTTKASGDKVQAAHVNDLQDEVTAIEQDLVNGMSRVRLGASTLTIASDAVTATKSLHAVDTEGAAATDNLSTISAGSGVGSGHLLTLYAANAARVVTVKDSVGNITLAGGDFSLDSAKKSILLRYDGTNWVEVSRASLPGLVGTTTNDSAAAGYVGQEIISTVTRAGGATIALTTTVAANITSVSLTAGDWDVSGFIGFATGTTTNMTLADGSISTVSATAGIPLFHVNTQGVTQAADSFVWMAPQRVSLSATTTYYLVGSATFGSSTVSAYGTLRARRMR